MLFLIDTYWRNLKQCSLELGQPVGQFFTPSSSRKNIALKFGIDNGSFKNFNEHKFLSLVNRHSGFIHNCLFVTCPDVLANAQQTLWKFIQWKDRLKGWPLAYVLQDGNELVNIPWDSFTCLFIGGTTQFKDSDYSLSMVTEAKKRGKWVHIGRINSSTRFIKFLEVNADSCDGSGISQYSHQRIKLRKELECYLAKQI